MSRDITEVIDDYCLKKYGHTNWDWTDTLYDEEDQRRMSELGELEGNIIFYFKKVSDDNDWNYILHNTCNSINSNTLFNRSKF